MKTWARAAARAAAAAWSAGHHCIGSRNTGGFGPGLPAAGYGARRTLIGTLARVLDHLAAGSPTLGVSDRSPQW